MHHYLILANSGHHATLTWDPILKFAFQGHHTYILTRLDERNMMLLLFIIYLWWKNKCPKHFLEKRPLFFSLPTRLRRKKSKSKFWNAWSECLCYWLCWTWWYHLFQNLRSFSWPLSCLNSSYLTLRGQIVFYPLFTQSKFREKCPRSCQDPRALYPTSSEVLPIFMMFKSFRQRKTLSYKALYHGQSGSIPRSAVAHHVLPKSTFKDKTSWGMYMSDWR